MRRIGVRLGIFAFLFIFALPALAGVELLILEKPMCAEKLAGVVVDSTGAPVSGVTIEDCDPAFNRVLLSTTTDSTGHFAFLEAKTGTTHYLHVQANGFDPMRITVVLRRFAKAKLRIRLHIAT
ncbi:MAG: carboxypeptidase-like regulatory domain-containing protein [Terracidiphilus sp.]|jgi:hypothetical protein